MLQAGWLRNDQNSLTAVPKAESADKGARGIVWWGPTFWLITITLSCEHAMGGGPLS